MIGNFLDWLASGVFEFLGGLAGILPTMPLSADSLAAYMSNSMVVTVLQWVNYFVPVSVLLGILGAWVTAIGVYSGIKMALKYGKGVLWRYSSIAGLLAQVSLFTPRGISATLSNTRSNLSYVTMR